MPFYDEIGGADTCRKIAEAFYGRVDGDPVLRPFFPGKNHRCAIEAFTAFLIQFLGGPPEQTQFRHFLSLRESHARFRIGGRERDAWMAQMSDALDEIAMPQSARDALLVFFNKSSAHIIRADAVDVQLDEELADRWQVQVSLDAAVAAIHRGDAERALALADPSCGRSRFAKLLTGGFPGGGRESPQVDRAGLGARQPLRRSRDACRRPTAMRR